MKTVRWMETAMERSRTTEQSTEDGLENLVPLLYGPRLPHRWAEDGTLVLPAPTQQQCESKLDFALKLIHEARYQAQKGGALTARPQPADDHRKLGTEEMDKALTWLKTRYREKYLTCPGIQEPGNFAPARKRTCVATSEADSERSSGIPSETLLSLMPYCAMATQLLKHCWPSCAKSLKPAAVRESQENLNLVLSRRSRTQTSRQQQRMQDESI